MIERVDDNKSTIYWLDGKIHRPNGPATLTPSGSRWCWWLYGKLHRYYGPVNRSGEWILHNKFVKFS